MSNASRSNAYFKKKLNSFFWQFSLHKFHCIRLADSYHCKQVAPFLSWQRRRNENEKNYILLLLDYYIRLILEWDIEHIFRTTGSQILLFTASFLLIQTRKSYTFFMQKSRALYSNLQILKAQMHSATFLATLLATL